MSHERGSHNLKGVVSGKLRRDARDIARFLRSLRSLTEHTDGYGRPTLEDQIKSAGRQHKGSMQVEVSKKETTTDIIQSSYRAIEGFFNEIRDCGMVQQEQESDIYSIRSAKGKAVKAEYCGRTKIGGINAQEEGAFSFLIRKQGKIYTFEVITEEVLERRCDPGTNRFEVVHDVFRFEPKFLEYKIEHLIQKNKDQHLVAKDTLFSNGMSIYDARYIHDKFTGYMDKVFRYGLKKYSTYE